MNNQEAYFSKAPTESIKRSSFDRSSTLKTTFNAGKLIPIYLDEVLPGDTFSMDVSSFIRMATPIYPVMDNCYVDLYFFFVPNRLVWDNWEKFNGANDNPWITSPYTGTVPQINIAVGDDDSPKGTDGSTYVSIKVGDMLDYLGIPADMVLCSTSGSSATTKINALPVRAVCKIWNDWFRDENLQAALNIYTGDNAVSYIHSGTSGTTIYLSSVTGGMLLPCAKYHDIYTSSLPGPQRHADVLIPLNNFAYLDCKGSSIVSFTGTTAYLDSPDAEGRTPYTDNPWTNYISSAASHFNVEGSNLGIYGSQLAGTINELRMAFQLQKLFEKDARGGTRYIEILKEHFGVQSPDARLQRSEYLGGKRIPITMNQVVQQSASVSGQTPIGQVSGVSVTRDFTSAFTKSFVEHGFVLGFACARTDKTYCQGYDRIWTKKSRFDYYWPALANIGEQPIYKYELNAKATFEGTGEGSHETYEAQEVFGYQEAWAEYRYKANRVSAYMRGNLLSGSLGKYWSYQDIYSDIPSLSDAWIREDAANIDRTLAVSSDTAHQFIADFYFKLKTTRPMPLYSIPGLADHH